MPKILPTLQQNHRAGGAGPSTPLIRLTRENRGDWTVVTADRRKRAGFVDLADAILYARRSCAAAAATLWLSIDGLVVIVPQDRGWTRPLLGERSSGR